MLQTGPKKIPCTLTVSGEKDESVPVWLLVDNGFPCEWFLKKESKNQRLDVMTFHEMRCDVQYLRLVEMLPSRHEVGGQNRPESGVRIKAR